LRRLGTEIALRELHDWRPLSLRQVPAEVVPMVERINTLLLDVQQSVALQRRFVADAAHQLRTPVAGIALARAERGPLARARWTQRRPLLGELRHSTERLARLIGNCSLAGSKPR
jgi:two-component system sensor histidine kinase TctE